MEPTSGTDTATERPSRRAPAGRAAARPVFVDPSGRRQRRVRRISRFLVIPAAGYIVLLLSAVLGGPSMSSPYLPLPQGDHQAGLPGSAPGTATGTAHHGSGGTTPSARASGSASSPAPSLSPSAVASAPTTSSSPTVQVTRTKSTPTHPVPSHSGKSH